MFRFSTRRPKRSAARTLAMASRVGSSAASRAASPLLATRRWGRSGNRASTQIRVWANDWGWARSSAAASGAASGWAARTWWTGNSSSPQMPSGEAARQSRVRFTIPSVVFSTGTTP